MLSSLPKLRLATRSSPLALWQARLVAARLEEAGFGVELVSLETIGDKKLDVALSKIGDKGVFTQELEALLLQGEAHLAVHSAKDMPSRLPEGLEIVAFTEREEAHDVLVSPDPDFRLENRPHVIGTASTRRVATLKRHFPAIETVAVRGNLQTRIRKMEEGQCHALLLAYAGVHRMGFGSLIRQHLPLDLFTPAVGQGSLAIEIATGLDPEVKSGIRSALNHAPTEACLLTERAFLRTMEGGCSVPVFGYARYEKDEMVLSGGIVALDGSEEIRKEVRFTAAATNTSPGEAVGARLAQELLASGGSSILQKIKQDLQR